MQRHPARILLACTLIALLAACKPSVPTSTTSPTSPSTTPPVSSPSVLPSAGDVANEDDRANTDDRANPAGAVTERSASMSLPTTPSASATASELRIGAWNIEWLGFPDRRGRPGKDNPQAPEDLADYIAASGVDVLALAEVGVDSETPPLRSTPFDLTVRALQDRHQQPWNYVLFPKTNYPDEADEYMRRGQHVGLAWRTDRATMVGEPWNIPVGSHPEFGLKFFERRANAVKLSFGQGRTDAVFIPVHLKSNRKDENNPDPGYTQRQREAELGAFAQWLPQLKEQFQDEDIVLLGDTNILDGQDTGKVLTENGFVDLNQNEQGTTAVWGDGSTGYRTAPFDRIFVPEKQSEFAKSQLKVHRTANGMDDEIKLFRRKLSDHYLISSAIEISADDD